MTRNTYSFGKAQQSSTLTGCVDDQKARIADPFLSGLTEGQVFSEVVDIAERTELDHLESELSVYRANVEERRRRWEQEFGRKSAEIVAPLLFDGEINGDDIAMIELLARYVRSSRLKDALGELDELETKKAWVSMLGPEKAGIALSFYKRSMDEQERGVILSACQGTPLKRLGTTIEKRLAAWRKPADAVCSYLAAKKLDEPSQTED